MEHKKPLDSQTEIDNFCARFDIRPAHWPRVEAGYGFYAIVDAGKKDLGDLIGKLWRKMDEAELDYAQTDRQPSVIFNLLRDYARCSVLMDDFNEAPELMANMRQRLGGEISVHNRDAYKAFHLHTQLGGINCEVQFHTHETYDLKLATDGLYKKWRKPMAENKAAVLANPEYIKEHNVMRPLCKAIYDRSGFDQTLPAVEQLRSSNHPLPPMTYQNILMIDRRAAEVQEDLIRTVQDELDRLSIKRITTQHDVKHLSEIEINKLLTTIDQRRVTQTAPQLLSDLCEK